jgi:excinuclease UvrABC nuclease subunit
MNTTLQSKKLIDELVSLSPEQRAEIEKRAGELAKNKDFRKAAEMLEKSQSLENIEDTKFVSEFGWLSALSVAIAALAIIGV